MRLRANTGMGKTGIKPGFNTGDSRVYLVAEHVSVPPASLGCKLQVFMLAKCKIFYLLFVR